MDPPITFKGIFLRSEKFPKYAKYNLMAVTLRLVGQISAIYWKNGSLGALHKLLYDKITCDMRDFQDGGRFSRCMILDYLFTLYF